MKTRTVRCQCSGILGVSLGMLAFGFSLALVPAAARGDTASKAASADYIPYKPIASVQERIGNLQSAVAEWQAGHPTLAITQATERYALVDKKLTPVGLDVVYEDRHAQVVPLQVVYLTLGGKPIIIASTKKLYIAASRSRKDATVFTEDQAWPELLKFARKVMSEQSAKMEPVAVIRDGLAEYMPTRQAQVTFVLCKPSQPVLTAGVEP